MLEYVNVIFGIGIRRTKAHSKSFDWLNKRLALFFVNLNLKGHKIAI